MSIPCLTYSTPMPSSSERTGYFQAPTTPWGGSLQSRPVPPRHPISVLHACDQQSAFRELDHFECTHVSHRGRTRAASRPLRRDSVSVARTCFVSASPRWWHLASQGPFPAHQQGSERTKQLQQYEGAAIREKVASATKAWLRKRGD